MDKNEKLASEFIEALKVLVNDEQKLYNFECYLLHHFNTWMIKFANNPESLVSEIKEFSKIEY